jgi:hypothetical protein
VREVRAGADLLFQLEYISILSYIFEGSSCQLKLQGNSILSCGVETLKNRMFMMKDFDIWVPLIRDQQFFDKNRARNELIQEVEEIEKVVKEAKKDRFKLHGVIQAVLSGSTASMFSVIGTER